MKTQDQIDSEHGVIFADRAYSIDALKLRLGIRRTGWNNLVAAGLPVKKIGRRGFVAGSDFLKFLEKYENN